jgi:two-component system, NarL family, response regulator NreC
MSIKILLADDHRIVREGLRSILESESDIEIVGEASDGATALSLVRKLIPDLIVMDISMPDLNGVEATRKILGEYPEIKVIALSMHSDKRFVVEMLDAGASGYLLKDCASEELSQAIHGALAGETYISHGITASVIRKLMEPETDNGERSSVLTKKELVVLKYIAEGLNTKEIADKLTVSVKTVESHRLHIMEKLEIHNIAELIKHAIRIGLISINHT